MRLGGMILTGGASRRMGQDKAAILWSGVRAVDRIAEIARLCGAAPVITVGARTYGLPFAVDKPEPGGPVGGVLAGADMLREAGCDTALVLATDAPTMIIDDLALLLGGGAPGAAFEGLPLPMIIDLAAIPADARPNWPLARLVECAGLLIIPCDAAVRARVRGANTPEEHAALLASLKSG